MAFSERQVQNEKNRPRRVRCTSFRFNRMYSLCFLFDAGSHIFLSPFKHHSEILFHPAVLLLRFHLRQNKGPHTGNMRPGADRRCGCISPGPWHKLYGRCPVFLRSPDAVLLPSPPCRRFCLSFVSAHSFSSHRMYVCIFRNSPHMESSHGSRSLLLHPVTL